MKLSDSLFKIFVRLLYLTPIGIFINLFYLFTGKRTPGIIIERSFVFVKENPTIRDRINWLINGLFILAEWHFFIEFFDSSRISINSLLLFGPSALVAFIACLCPRFNWNKISFLSGVIILLIISFLFFFLTGVVNLVLH